MLLEFIYKLMYSDASLSKDIYETKKYMRDLGFGYEKFGEKMKS